MHTGCGPGSTYIPSTRNVLHIVLGAQARGDVAEVHLFGDYLNLHGHGIAARRSGAEGGGSGGHQRGGKKKKKVEKSRGEEITITG